MKQLIILIFLALSFLSCENKPTLELKPTIAKAAQIIQPRISQTMPIPELWNVMVFKKGGCLGGTQHIKDFKREIPTMVFSEKEWKTFSKRDTTEVTNFLLSKLADTTTTAVHTCPFSNATNGEMAVYALQHIYDINWYNFAHFKEYDGKKITSATDQPQIWLQNILKNEKEREKLASLFKNKLKN
ncbi:hypothetical protein M4I21_13435 [Cellulophaga sp. 20_2_10]|uniref:hypothetical protein n=1 Tax=Cellulophaga sp. 20_2_10 TaxID=2942476 RepID=UPI00201AD021|nr:hypothetical protein [Cellulophaga sp. 20_2_10]MCL5246822.1 hypothetical protein [Cellulophaga sp. 20_2_10]